MLVTKSQITSNQHPESSNQKMNYQHEYKKSIEQPEAFWLEQANHLCWYEAPIQALSTDKNGFYRWFKGGKMNTAYLALNYHIENGRSEQTAIIYDSPVTGKVKKYTYNELRNEVAKFAGVLTNLGVEKGDRVVVYMPMIPRVAIAILACARIGAVHSVIFGGFAPHELAIRIDDAKPKVILAASGGLEVKKVIAYKPTIDKGIQEATHKPSAVVLFQRDFIKAEMQKGRDYDWEELVAKATPQPCVIMNATDPLYILYTSGTNGVPKGIIRDNGGHAIALKYSMKHVYGVESGDVYWAASDVGWVVGHSYILYAPLIHGCTTILFEGKPVRTPDAGTF